MECSLRDRRVTIVRSHFFFVARLFPLAHLLFTTPHRPAALETFTSCPREDCEFTNVSSCQSLHSSIYLKVDDEIRQAFCAGTLLILISDMRLPCHIVCLFLAAPLHSVLALPGQGVRPREDGNDFAGASTLTSVSDKKQQQSLTETSNTSNQAKLTTSVAAPTSTELTGPSSVTGISSATSSAASPSSSGMHSATDHSKAAADIVLTAWIYPGHGLPLEPKVTPAVAIAGVVLIVSGALYALIGIRNSWLVATTSLNSDN